MEILKEKDQRFYGENTNLTQRTFAVNTVLRPGMWKRSFFCGSGSRGAKILPLPLPHRLFDLKNNLAKKFCPFSNVNSTLKLHTKSERPYDISSAREQEKV